MLAADPLATVAPNGQLLLTWDEIRDRRAHHDLAAAELTRGVWQNLEAPPPVGWSRFRPAPFWLAGFKVAVQDMSPKKNGLSIWAPGLTPFRLDDSGNAPNQLTRPRAASRSDGSSALLVFEDDRDGWVRIRSQSLRPGIGQ